MSFRKLPHRVGPSWQSAATIASAALLLTASAWQRVAAQEAAESLDLRLRIVAASTGQPIPDASVTLLAEDSVLVDHAISDEEGRAPLEAPPGPYRIRVERMDLEPWTSDPLPVEEGEPEQRTIRIPLRPVSLPELDIETEDGRCPGTREERQRGYQRYREVVEALRPVARLEASHRHVFQVRIEEEIFRHKASFDGLHTLAPTRSVLLPQPIATLDPDNLARRGYIQPGEGASLQYYAPTAGTVVSDAFARTHCFRTIEGEGGDRRGLAFQPLPDREIPDVEGAVWLGADTGAPLELEYTYTGLNRILGRYEVPRIVADLRRRARDDRGRIRFELVRDDTKIDEDPFGGRLRFERVGDSSWVTRHWRLRFPILVDGSRWTTRMARGPTILVQVDPMPLERSGTVTGIARVAEDSAASEKSGGQSS